ncbi:MAG: DUF5309 domain-containing protein [Roseburia sp.]|nr:DUF5309 domain-containing protein [Roseburia sp.]
MADMVKRSDFLQNEVIDLADEIKLVSPTDTPLTTLLMGRGQTVPATDITVTWRERKLNDQRGTLKLEGAEAGDAIKSSRGSLSNICQIIEKVTQVSGTAQALNPKGIGNSFQSEVSDRLTETKRDLEWYFINGTKTMEADSTPRQMDGLMNLVNDENVIDGTGKTFSEELILDALQGMWDHGANGEYFSFVNASVKRMVNGLLKNGTNVKVDIDNSMDQVLGITVAKIQSDFGVINLVLDRHMVTDAMLTVDLEQVEIAELRGTFYEDLPKSGDYFRGHVLNESTIKLLNSYAGSKIINIGKTE